MTKLKLSGDDLELAVKKFNSHVHSAKSDLKKMAKIQKVKSSKAGGTSGVPVPQEGPHEPSQESDSPDLGSANSFGSDSASDSEDCSSGLDSD